MIDSMIRLWKNDIFNYLWYTFGANGWESFTEFDDNGKPKKDGNILSSYRLNILGNYRTTVIARTAEHKEQLSVCGSYGVLWIDAEYEHQTQLGFVDIDDISYALEKAEDNLLLIGIPFVKDYVFHGKNATNKKRKNDALRKKLNLNAIEEGHKKLIMLKQNNKQNM